MNRIHNKALAYCSCLEYVTVICREVTIKAFRLTTPLPESGSSNELVIVVDAVSSVSSINLKLDLKLYNKYPEP